MPLVDSLLGAIVRLDGNALVMHVGEKPYVVTGSSLDAYRGPLSWGQVELATKRLTLEAVAGMVRQLLPPDEQRALSDFGAIEHQLDPNPKVPGRFTVIAARGGDDIWLEIRYHRPVEPKTGAEPAARAPLIDQAAEPEPARAVPEETEPLAAEASTVELPPAGMTSSGITTAVASDAGADLALISEGEGVAPVPVAVEPAVEAVEILPAVDGVTTEPAAEEVIAIEAAMAEAAAFEPVAIEPVLVETIPGEGVVIGPVPTTPPTEPVWIEPEVAAPVPVAVEPAEEVELELAVEDVAVEPVAEAVAVEPAAQEVVAIEPVMAEAVPIELVAIEPMVAETVSGEAAAIEPPPAEPPAEPFWIEPEAAEPVPSEAVAVEPLPTEPVWIQPEMVAPAPAVVEPAIEEVAVEPAMEEAVAREPIAIEPVVVETVADEVAAVEPLPSTPAAELQRTPLDRLLRVAAARGASALYVVAQAPPAIRIDGEITVLESEGLLASADVAAMLMQPVPVATREAPPQEVEAEWIADVPGVGRVRCLSFRDHRGPGGIFRMLPARALSVEQLGLSRVIQALSAESEGLVLVTGPRASGKRALIAAFVDLVNRTRADHVITLESQILFVHQSRRSFVSQRELGGTSQELAAAARAALRENPDVLVIDDLRSPELISVALQAAELGLLVFAALPASGARAAIERVVDQFSPEQRAQVQTTLAGALRGVVAQVLVRKIGGGRLAAREVLLNTRAVAAVIAEGRTSELPLAIEDGRRHGMMPLNDALVDAVLSAAVDPAEAYRRTYDHEGLLDRLRREGIDTSFVERLA